MQVSRLPHRPPASLARLLADSGAINSKSAHRRSSMCNTSSPTWRQCRQSSSLPAFSQQISITVNKPTELAECDDVLDDVADLALVPPVVLIVI